MTRTEDRLADALGASARTLREDTLRPLAVPPRRDRRWARWLAPAAAAAAVTLVVVLVAALTGPSAAPSPAPSPAAGSAGLPRYYVAMGYNDTAVVRATATGAVTAAMPIHVHGVVPDGNITAAANGTFFLAAFTSQSQEQLYRFRLTAEGHISGFSAVPGGRFSDQASALAATANGARLAVATGRGPATDAKVTVIDVRTGARSVWQGGLARTGYPVATINSLSWASGQLVFAAQWCQIDVVNSQVCGSAVHGDRRTAEVRAIAPVPAGGRLSSSRVLLRQSPRHPYIASAVISPDGTVITALILHGPPAHASRPLPGELSVVQVSAASGRQLGVLYQRHTGPTFDWYLRPDGLAAHWLLTGVDEFGGGDGPHRLANLGYNGWISNGRLVPLQPTQGRIAGEAW